MHGLEKYNVSFPMTEKTYVRGSNQHPLDDPFGDYFDATYVYGPIFGRMTYVGLRYYIK